MSAAGSRKSLRGHLSIVAACEDDLERYGDSYLGVGWTKSKELAELRYRLMLDVIRGPHDEEVSLLDFGCGASHLLEYMIELGITGVRYSGLDLSPKFLALSRSKHPSVTYYELDVLEDSLRLPDFDYIILDGIFNYRGELSHEEMLGYCHELLRAVFPKAKRAIAFNVMSTQVDWERDDLFHLPLDELASFLTTHLSRHFVVRHDYGLYEYTTYVYREPYAPTPGQV
jgi:SAM-dependent methyltransferase